MKKILLVLIVVVIIGGVFYLTRSANSPSSVPTPSPSLIAEANYLCQGDKTINAAFYEGEVQAVAPGEPPIPTGSVKIILSDGRNFDLPQTISADGGRYAKSDESFVFWSKGNGALILENNVEKDYLSCLVLAKDPGGLPQTYLDSTTGFVLRYPADYSLDTAYTYQALGRDKDIKGVKFTIPSSFATGTNLSSFDTGVSVEAIPEATDCHAGLFLDGKTEVKTISENGREYSFTTTIGAAAGNRYEESVWAFPVGNTCLAVRYFIHYGAIENYEPGLVREFDRTALINQFDQIRQTLTTQ